MGMIFKILSEKNFPCRILFSFVITCQGRNEYAETCFSLAPLLGNPLEDILQQNEKVHGEGGRPEPQKPALEGCVAGWPGSSPTGEDLEGVVSRKRVQEAVLTCVTQLQDHVQTMRKAFHQSGRRLSAGRAGPALLAPGPQPTCSWHGVDAQ